MAEVQESSHQPRLNLERTRFWQEWLEGKTKEEIAKMLVEQELKAEHDALTGLRNRRGWDEALTASVSHARRENEPLSFLIIDIDSFKTFNDRHGHSAGDRVLILVARVLKEAVREADIIARIGGDEFGVILPATDLESGGKVKDKIVQAFQSAPFAIPISLSIGKSQLQEGEETEVAIDRADQDMYQVKGEIKNG